MDGGHLNGDWNGVMLTLTCKDVNNKLIHVATVIGPKENADLYQNLVRNCKKNPELKELLEDPKTTFFMDGQKGSPCAMDREVKDAQRRVCLKHMIGCLSEKVGSVSMTAFLSWRGSHVGWGCWMFCTGYPGMSPGKPPGIFISIMLNSLKEITRRLEMFALQYEAAAGTELTVRYQTHGVGVRCMFDGACCVLL